MLPETREQAIQKLKDEAYTVEADQNFVVARMMPEDAWGVARCFYEVYGEHYPFDTYYVPAKLIDESRQGNILGVVARTAVGDIVAFGALFRSSAHNPLMYEFGQGTVIPAYRSTFAILCIQDFIFSTVAPAENVDGIFGEAVCNHIITQKLSRISGTTDTGIELGLMPAATYFQGDHQPDRVSTVLAFNLLRDRACTIYLPAEYETVIRRSVAAMPAISRNPVVSADRIPEGSISAMAVNYFDHAQVLRISISQSGEDIEELLNHEEKQALLRGIVVVQIFVNLGEAWVGKTVTALRKRGYFYGGFLPGWFDADGLLMQRPAVVPDFKSIQLYSEQSQQLFDFIKKDIQDVNIQATRQAV